MGRLAGWEAFITRYCAGLHRVVPRSALHSVVCDDAVQLQCDCNRLAAVRRWKLFADAISGVVESAQQAGAAKQAQREVSCEPIALSCDMERHYTASPTLPQSSGLLPCS
jgi:hypothetical protein